MFELHHGIKSLEDLLEHAKTVRKQMIQAAGGEIVNGQGRLSLQTQQQDELDYTLAKSVMDGKELPPGEFDAACKVSKTKLLEQVRAQYARGTKSVEANRVMDLLREAGAVSQRAVEKVVYRREPERLEG